MAKAATARDEAKKSAETAKLLADKLVRDHGELLRRMANDKTITAQKVAEAKTAADKANADLATKTRTAEEVRLKRDRLQADDLAKKRELDRLTAEFAVKSTAAKVVQTAFEKTERDMKDARLKAEEQLKQADAKLAETKASKDKQLTELGAKVTELDTVRKNLDKENTDLWNIILKFAAERNQLKLQQTSAESVLGRANLDVALRKRTVQSAETLVAQSAEKKLASEKLLADAKATLDKRARAQFK